MGKRHGGLRSKGGRRWRRRRRGRERKRRRRKGMDIDEEDGLGRMEKGSTSILIRTKKLAKFFKKTGCYCLRLISTALTGDDRRR